MEKLLNFAEPLDVDLLDQVVYAFYSNPQKVIKQQYLELITILGQCSTTDANNVSRAP
jgi:hypothetical protein